MAVRSLISCFVTLFLYSFGFVSILHFSRLQRPQACSEEDEARLAAGSQALAAHYGRFGVGRVLDVQLNLAATRAFQVPDISNKFISSITYSDCATVLTLTVMVPLPCLVLPCYAVLVMSAFHALPCLSCGWP